MSDSQKLEGLPDGWQWATVDELSTVVRGGSPRPAGDPRYFGGNAVPWITVGSLTADDQPYLSSVSEFLTEEGKKRSRYLEADTLLLTNSGATLGVPKITRIAGCINDGSVALLGVGYPLKLYLYYFLKSMTQKLRAIRQGAAQPNLNTGIVKSIRVPVPPLNEQLRIVDKIEELFSDLDAGVAALERAKANLKRYRASVLKAAVEGKLTEEWRAEHPNTEPASKLLARILVERRQKWEADQLAKFAAAGKQPPKNWRDKYVEPTPVDMSGLPELPEGWVWVTIDHLLREPLRNGHSARTSGSNEGVRTLTLTAVTYGDFSERNVKYTTADPATVEDLWIEPGDILIERSNTPELVGTARLFNGPSRFAIFPDLLIRVRVLPKVHNCFCDVFLQSHLARSYFQSRAKGLAGSMPKIDQATIQRCPMPLPPLKEQIMIAAEIEQLLSIIDVAEQQINHGLLRADRLRQSILKQAFEGKLVPQDPKDEPAGVLLDRLKIVDIQADSTNGHRKNEMSRSKRVRK